MSSIIKMPASAIEGERAAGATESAGECDGGRRTVLHLIETGGPGGAETVMMRLIEHLDDSRWHSLAVVPWDGWLSASLRERGIRTRIVPSRGALDWRWLLDVVRLVRQFNVDVIQTHLFGSAVYGSAIGRLTNLPVVATIHGEVDFGPGDRGMRLKAALLRQHRTRLVAVSSSIRRMLSRELAMPLDRIALIPNGIDVGSYAQATPAGIRRQMRWGANDVVVGAVGNVRKPKDYGNLLDAAAMVLSRYPACRFAIAGDTEGEPELYKALLDRRNELGLEENVAFLGFRRDTAALLKDFDVYVMSSSREGLPLALLQAMAAGRPVVATQCGGPQEVVSDGINGILVPPQKPADLASALCTMIEQRTLASALGRQAHQTAMSSYALGAMIDSYEKLYRDNAGSGGR